jgi:DNA-binding FadR family transcriptional regulator
VSVDRFGTAAGDLDADGAVPPIRRARSDRVAETVAAALRERILGGGTADATLPTQEALMASFGVGAPSVREALRILEAEGLITVRRGKLGGAEVHRPDGASVAHAIGLTLQGERTHLRELAEALQVFEPLCAAACATRPDRHDVLLPALEDNLRRTADALGDGPAFTRLGREFHDLVVDGAPNPAVRLLVRSLVAVWTTQEESWASETWEAGKYPDIASQQRLLDEHRRMAQEIDAGDAAAAGELTRRHAAGHQEPILAAHGDRLIDATSPEATAGFRRLSFPAGRSREETA